MCVRCIYMRVADNRSALGVGSWEMRIGRCMPVHVLRCVARALGVASARKSALGVGKCARWALPVHENQRWELGNARWALPVHVLRCVARWKCALGVASARKSALGVGKCALGVASACCTSALGVENAS